ncbi:MAG: ABC transporter substrate-binding protein [Gemmatimonadales bacterium]
MTRVLSLVPAATEIVAALGAGSSLVGISHECDHPPSVLHLPRVTATPVDVSRPGPEIDAEVRRLAESGQPVITVDAALVKSLRPDLVIAQSLCDVCAVGSGQVQPLADTLPEGAAVLSLTGTTIAGVEDDIRRVAGALDLAAEADELIGGMRYRLRRMAPSPGTTRPRVVCVEWLDPLYLAGHWVPELVAAAGGEDIGGKAGEKSRRRAWAEVVAMRPDVILVMLCGFSVPRAQQEWAAFARANPGTIAMLGAVPVRFVDGNAYTSRPGPRLVEGAEQIAATLKEVRGERRV